MSVGGGRKRRFPSFQSFAFLLVSDEQLSMESRDVAIGSQQIRVPEQADKVHPKSERAIFS